VKQLVALLHTSYTLLLVSAIHRYDFAVYGLLAPEIGAAFFPKSSKKLQLINSFGVYLAAFLMRPVGAVLFGELGDRILGRKNALVFSIVLITIPSILLGLLPTYEQWGPTAPVLLVLFRMMQGLSVGGQLAGSYVISIEQSSSRTRGFRGSICDASSVSQSSLLLDCLYNVTLFLLMLCLKNL
jgi:MHS family proline/betaine transporter-like MFS transporter